MKYRVVVYHLKERSVTNDSIATLPIYSFNEACSKIQEHLKKDYDKGRLGDFAYVIEEVEDE